MEPVAYVRVTRTNKESSITPILRAGVLDIRRGTADAAPHVHVGDFGDFRPFKILVDGDVAILSPRGDVLSEALHKDLVWPDHLTPAVDAVLDPVRDALGVPRPHRYPERSSEIQKVLSGGAVQGREPQQLWNSTDAELGAVVTRYSDPHGKMKFIPGRGFDLMDELIQRGHAPKFAQLFEWVADAPPNGTWDLYVNNLDRDGDFVIGILEVSRQAHIVITRDRVIPVESLTSLEKESFGLKFYSSSGWRIEQYNGRQLFTISLVNNYIWDIRAIPSPGINL